MAKGRTKFALLFAACLWSQPGAYVATDLPFVYEPSKTSRKYLLEAVGSGVALFDHDGDGRLDIYMVNGAAIRDPMPKGGVPDKSDPRFWNRLYRNTESGRFEDVTERVGLRGTHYGMGAAAADFDNDGDTDLYVTGYRANQLFRNEGGKFTDITAQAGVAGGGWSTGAAWIDADNDGKLDLAVARYMEWDFEPDEWCGVRKEGYRSYCHPDRFKPATYFLYRNLGGGKFADHSASSGFGKAPGKGMGIAVADYDLDGKVDIAVANDAAPQQLFHNEGGMRFTEVAFDNNVAYDDDGRVFSGMGIEFADYDNDGRPDLLVNALALQCYALYRNKPGEFEYVSAHAGITTPTRNHSGWGMRIADLDNDGLPDIVVAQSHVMDNIELTQPSVKYKEPLLLLRNDGKRFVDDTRSAGPAVSQPRAGRGAAFGDLDNDGVIDMVVSAQQEHAVVLRRAPSSTQHWLLVKLEGTAGNRDGIGARVRIAAGGRQQFRTVSTAGSYLSSNDVRAHFGLGATKIIDELEVEWPSGKRQKITGVAVDRILTLREP
ncbi:MAG TPA: CRTAC1 family protein [Bryobacteraceae bacterium]|nr:CRTAC1 family protein [Bryobacteraceae bacterium]